MSRKPLAAEGNIPLYLISTDILVIWILLCRIENIRKERTTSINVTKSQLLIVPLSSQNVVNNYRSQWAIAAMTGNVTNVRSKKMTPKGILHP
jgi:hypothetical protein